MPSSKAQATDPGQESESGGPVLLFDFVSLAEVKNHLQLQILTRAWSLRQAIASSMAVSVEPQSRRVYIMFELLRTFQFSGCSFGDPLVECCVRMGSSAQTRATKDRSAHSVRIFGFLLNQVDCCDFNIGLSCV